VLKIRKMDHQERSEQEEILTLYLHALGMVPQENFSEKTENEVA